MRVSKFRLLSALVLVCMALGGTGAWGQPLDHANPPPMVSVEHAEILMPTADDSAAKAFLIIWNGTETQTSLASVKSNAFASATIMRTIFTSEGNAAEPVNGGPLAIPAHAELQMRAGGIHMILADPRAAITQSDSLRLTLVFDDGRELEVSARVVPAPELLTRHRHGDDDRGLD